MKRTWTAFKCAPLFFLIWVCLFGQSVGAQEGETFQFTMSYEGELLDAADEPVTASYGMTFRIYNSDGDTEPVWTEVYDSVDVVDGRFYVDLGSITAFEGTLAEQTELYLGLEVGDGGELSPRMRLGGSLRSQFAEKANQADHATDVLGEDIHPSSVSVGETLVIDAEGKWVGDSTGLVGPEGPAGVDGIIGIGVRSIAFNENGELVTVMTDDSELNAGALVWSQTCPEGSSIRGFDIEGQVLCEFDDDTQSTYDGTDFALSDQACLLGEIMTGINEFGGVVCICKPRRQTH